MFVAQSDAVTGLRLVCMDSSNRQVAAVPTDRSLAGTLFLFHKENVFLVRLTR